jgi:hypothetical protein
MLNPRLNTLGLGCPYKSTPEEKARPGDHDDDSGSYMYLSFVSRKKFCKPAKTLNEFILILLAIA